MKIQISTKTGNSQVSDDDTTTQVQVGRGYLIAAILVMGVGIACLVYLHYFL